MTSDRQRAANRENARKSTGPRTQVGKVASSGNARRHGLTGALPEEDVIDWYRVLVDDPGAVPDPFETDPCLLAAANLARAEAQFQRAREAQEDWWLDDQAPSTREVPRSESEKSIEEDREMVLEVLVWNAMFNKPLRMAREGRFFDEPFRRPASLEEFFDLLMEHAQDRHVRVGWDKSGFKLLRRIEKRIARDRFARRVAHQRQGPRLDRYRASAEANRHKALRRWINEIAKRTQYSQARDQSVTMRGSLLPPT